MIQFVDADPRTLLNEAVARYEAASGETLYPGDEHYLFLSQLVELLVANRAETNVAANKNLLENCTGELLDEYGKQRDVSRIPAKTASATVEFALSAALAFDVAVPAGTRVTPDGQLIFALSDDVVIAAGETSEQGTVDAAEPGAAYNGFLPGQINSMVDPVEYIATAQNVTESAGGSDEEDDDSYRERIRQSPEALSTAGSKESYEFWAKTASADIVQARAAQTAAGEVTIYVLMGDAAAPSQEILDAVAAACSAEKRRPLTDHVIVAGAEAVVYDIALTYYISAGRATEEAAIKEAAEQAVADFADAQKKQLGGNLNPDDLRDALRAAGAYRIDLTSPAFTALEEKQVAVAGTITMTYGGLL